MNRIRLHVWSLIERQFVHGLYFYRHLRYRLFVMLGLSITVGVMDGLGLSMFIPLMQFTTQQSQQTDPDTLGNLRFVVDGLLAIGLRPTLPVVLLVMLLFFMLKGGIAFFAARKRVYYTQHYMGTLREHHIRALANYDYKQFAQADIGRIQNTLSGEIGRVSQAMNTYLSALNSTMMILVYVTLAVLSNAQFAILVVAGAFLSNRAFQAIYAQTERLSGEVSRVGHAYQRLLIQQSANFKYLKATGFIRTYAEKLVTEVRRMEEVNRRIGVLGAIVSGVREPLMILIVVAVILVQVVLRGGSLALIVLSILFFYRALAHVLTLQGQWNGFLGLTGSIRNLTEFTAQLERHREPVGPTPFTRLTQGLSLQGVSFHYQPGREVLRDVSLDIQRNETVAIVGESGSGKTTLVNVLAGLLIPTEGTMRVDGRPIGEWDVTTYQRRIGYITQEPVIFDDTLFHNVTLWAEDTPETRARAEHALRQAQLQEFVHGLPNGLDARLGNGGVTLSGGQRQRVAIARELYKEVDILLMDEATSSLDTESEHQIKANIDLLKGRYTIVIIAHRLSTIRDADRVVVMRHGRVETIGTFDGLGVTSPAFQRMLEFQAV